MQRELSVTNKSRDRRALQIDAKVFTLAIRSYPELFRRKPNVSFEEHFLSLIVAAQSHTSDARSCTS